MTSLAFCDVTKSCLMPSEESRYLRHPAFALHNRVHVTGVSVEADISRKISIDIQV